VSDIGSFATRIGYAGDDLPRAYFPTVSIPFSLLLS
jgi:actin-related protein